ISALSSSTLALGDLSIPIMPVLGAGLLITLIVALRPYITRTLLLGVAVVVVMLTIANQITDYYFDHNFYDLQQNWHYLAYGIFAYIIYRDLTPRKVPAAKIMLITYRAALGFSTFDEVFQMQLSSRVFDVCDIGKDLWGCLMGIVMIYFATTDRKTLATEWRQVRQPQLKDDFRRRPSLLILMFIFALLLLSISSVLTEREYCGYVVSFTLGGFGLFLLLFHSSRHQAVKFTLVTILVGAFLVQAYLFATHNPEKVIRTEEELTNYHGIRVPFFDLMVFPGGSFRPVDKKRFFNNRDQEFLLKQGADIIVVATGSDGSGGLGFPTKAPVQFVYDHKSQRAVQVVCLQNRRATELFNRLKNEGKNVLLVVHHAC
ncbi:MAG: VanZ family protein, partial [bacterium]